VNGTGYTPSSVVRINGSDRATIFGSATQLTATIFAADIAVPGAQSIAVFAPTRGTSAAVTLMVNNPAPTLTSITPGSRAAWGPAFTLTANGSGFVTTSSLRVNGAARPTTYVSPTQLTAAIPATDLATAPVARS
jgi:hypothetical protein